MSNSTRRGFFNRKSPNQVTVLEANVHHTAARNAKASLIVVGLVACALSLVVLLDRLHPVLAVLGSLVIGVVVGGLAWVAVVVWPVVRLLWWWASEIVLLGVTFVAASALAHVALWVRLVVIGALVGLGFVAPVRRTVIGIFWCLFVRHRLRKSFADYITANRSGSLPFILFAVPTPVGERVWVFLRSGLSLPILEARLDQLAVSCMATSVKVGRAREGGNSAFVRFDIKRREVLTATVGSPLSGLVDPDAPTAPRQAGPVPTALNLGDVPDQPLFAAYAPSSARPDKAKAAANGSASANGSAPAAPPATPEDDASDWI
ncbi:hypothetical protein [Catellatospora citrea]|uniref:Uncharacterized protein n=1 Tax=Catellatospora citrea TaxID=53366 RepID=A0A8J3KWJ3_9ACTN|nr:hypothetical protein [Catellatospora citrea]RKE08176.1 hypothetical protein C8E86_3020 [Catellatospora citrea]GIG03250.1 hypothetical protein Cci01nite_83430 [Catellatospora citrea]